MPFERCRITAEGDVAFCCFMRDDPLRPRKHAYLGNLLESKTFDEVWFGEKAEQVRKDTKKGILSEMCRCPGCPWMSSKPPYPKRDITFGEYPCFLEIDLPNTHCNVGGVKPDAEKSPACIMCERASPLFQPEEDHLLEALPKLLPLMPSLHQIHIQGISEPFWKDLIFDVLEILEFEQHKNRITISTTTNATIFGKEVRQRYLELCPRSITSVSLDAATPETYKTLRIFSAPVYARVLSNLYAFSKERVRDRQFLRVTNNINICNVHEVREMCRIAAKANVEFVEFNATDGFNHKILVNEKNCGQFARAQLDIIDECEKLNVPYSFVRPLDMGLTDQLTLRTL